MPTNPASFFYQTVPDFWIVGHVCKTDISDIDILHIDNNLKSKIPFA